MPSRAWLAIASLTLPLVVAPAPSVTADAADDLVFTPPFAMQPQAGTTVGCTQSVDGATGHFTMTSQSCEAWFVVDFRYERPRPAAYVRIEATLAIAQATPLGTLAFEDLESPCTVCSASGLELATAASFTFVANTTAGGLAWAEPALDLLVFRLSGAGGYVDATLTEIRVVLGPQPPPTGPDLYLRTLTVTQPAVAGQMLDIVATVENRGNAPSNATDVFFMVTGADGGTTGSLPLPSLAPGDGTTVTYRRRGLPTDSGVWATANHAATFVESKGWTSTRNTPYRVAGGPFASLDAWSSQSTWTFPPKGGGDVRFALRNHGNTAETYNVTISRDCGPWRATLPASSYVVQPDGEVPAARVFFLHVEAPQRGSCDYTMTAVGQHDANDTDQVAVTVRVA